MKVLYKFVEKNKDGNSVEYGIKKPSRMDMDEEQMFRSAEMSRCIKRGILTKDMLVKEYLNVGGALSDSERKEISEAYQNILSIENEHKFLKSKSKKTAEDEERVKELESQFINAISLINEFETRQENLFANSADVLARNKSIVWLFTQVLLKRPFVENEDGKWEKVFPYSGYENHEKNLDFYEEINDSDDEVLKTAFLKALTMVSLWYHGKASTEEDFRNIDNQFTKQDDEDEDDEIEEVAADQVDESVEKPAKKRNVRKKSDE